MRERGDPGAQGGTDPRGHALAVAYVDYDKLLADFLRHAEAANAARWAMGDLAASLHDALHRSPELRRQFARQGLSMAAFARAVGLAPAALEALRLTAEAFTSRERHPGLTWEHHWILAVHAPSESTPARRKWLREAGKKHWTPHQLRRQLRPPTQRPETCAEERVRRLRAQLAEAEAELEIRRKGKTRSRRTSSPRGREK